jgi:UDP-N-acetylglucosamine 1-carboxyvinyltransferase
MGASIRVIGRSAIIEGTTHLTGAPLKASDLRAGAALVIAALCAQGQSELEGISYIERGSEKMISKLAALGADIKTVYTPDDLSMVEREVV